MPEFTSYASGTPCWTDITSPELDRSVSFYSDLFGWEAEQDPRPEAGGYTMFKRNGEYVAAGSPPFPGSEDPAHWTTYIASDDVDATAARVSESGGTLLTEPFDVLDAERMAVAQDPGGATFGIWQAGAHHVLSSRMSLALSSGTSARRLTREGGGVLPRSIRLRGRHDAVGDSPLHRVLKIDGKSIGGLMPIGPEMGELPPN